jgi:tetratricopeptide (TPR) repeat protein
MQSTRSKGVGKSPAVFLIAVLLAVMTLAAYWPVKSHDFLEYDDDLYVTANRQVRQGLTWEGVSWAFGAGHAKNWHPVTWISHMADIQLYGAYAGGHHMVNVVFHIINALLLFYLLHRTTGFMWRSAFTAAFFALHPLHVESVSWISERKDLLCAFFWLLTLLAYAGYARRPGLRRYGAVVVFFILALMSKPMAVTLPFVLILMDVWPLQRFSFQDQGRGFSWSLLWGKIPLMGLSAASSLITYLVQKSGGAVGTLGAYPPAGRFANALISYVRYMGNMFWPADLTVFYPYPEQISAWQTAGAAILLIAITLLAIVAIKRRPWFASGWFWYLGTLIPVIGLVQIGLQSHADRYTYIPLIGLFVIVVWTVSEFAGQRPFPRNLSFAAGLAAVILLGISSYFQTAHWKDTHTLFTSALAVTENNYVAHNALGILEARKGNRTEASAHYQAALAAKPDYASVHNNLGLVLAEQGMTDQAVFHYHEAVRIDPKFSRAHNNLGAALMRQNKIDEAMAHFRQAIETDSDYPEAYNNLGNALVKKGKIDEAIENYRRAVKIEPSLVMAHYNLGNALAAASDLDGAAGAYFEALRLDTDFTQVHNNLGTVLARKGDLGRAVEHFELAVQYFPEDAAARKNLEKALEFREKQDPSEITGSETNLIHQSDENRERTEEQQVGRNREHP